MRRPRDSLDCAQGHFVLRGRFLVAREVEEPASVRHRIDSSLAGVRNSSCTGKNCCVNNQLSGGLFELVASGVWQCPQ